MCMGALNHPFVWLGGMRRLGHASRMKATFCPLALVASLIPTITQEDTYIDGTGDSNTGHSSLDITSVVVNNDATTLSLQINLGGSPTANDRYKYLVGFDTVVGGNTTGPDAWGKPISMSTGGMDYFIGSWMNFGTGADVRSWSGSSWDAVSGSGIAVATGASSVTLSLNLSALGLSEGSTFNFDIYSSSDGNSALDAAGSGTVLTWGNTPYDSSPNVLSYTVTAVPEPSALSLLGLIGLLMAWRAQRKRT
jgi:hypothetical protein